MIHTGFLYEQVTGLTEIIIEPGKETAQISESTQQQPMSTHQSDSETVFVKPQETRVRSIPPRRVEPSPFLDPSSVEIEVGKEGEMSDEEQVGIGLSICKCNLVVTRL